MRKKIVFFINLLVLFSTHLFAGILTANYDEQLVGNYKLPELMLANDGSRVVTKKDWEKRRLEILKAYEENIYGKIPKYSGKIKVKKVKKVVIWDGTTILEEVNLTMENGIDINVAIFKPNKPGKFQSLIGLNFGGNQTITDNENISIFDEWIDSTLIQKPEFQKAVINNKGTEHSRNSRGGYRWDIKQMIKNNIIFITACYNDISPDNANLYKKTLANNFKGINPNETSAISVWAWGNERIMDYILTRNDIKVDKVALYGHSRLGKTALWTGANDKRFAAIISNESGEGGAALLRRNYGETIGIINTQFPHWFMPKFKEFNDKPNSIPVDQHMLISMIAPRPIYIASASDDQWADPKGEYLSLYYASPVYQLLTGEEFKRKEADLIPVDTTISGIQSYHIRTGVHSTNKFDWDNYILFMKKYL